MRLPCLGIGHERLWLLQGWGLVALTFLSFFPTLIHVQVPLSGALIVLAGGTAWLVRAPLWTRTPVDMPLIGLLAWILLTIPWAINPAYSFNEWRKLAAKILVFYWALLVCRHERTRSLLPQVMIALVLGMGVLSIYGLADFVVRGGSWKDRTIRALAPGSDYNWLSTYAVMTLPLLVVAWLVLRGPVRRVASASALIGAAGTMLFAYTRAAWLGLAIQGLAAAAFTRGRWLLITLTGMCVGIVVGLYALAQHGYHLATVDPWTAEARLELWGLATRELLEHPLVGIGFGNNTFRFRFPDVVQRPGHEGVHSLFLMVAMGSGLPALGCLVWVFWSAVRAMLNRAQASAERDERLWSMGVALMVIGFAVRNLFDYMAAGSIAYLFWILVALGLMGARNAPVESVMQKDSRA